MGIGEQVPTRVTVLYIAKRYPYPPQDVFGCEYLLSVTLPWGKVTLFDPM